MSLTDLNEPSEMHVLAAEMLDAALREPGLCEVLERLESEVKNRRELVVGAWIMGATFAVSQVAAGKLTTFKAGRG